MGLQRIGETVSRIMTTSALRTGQSGCPLRLIARRIGRVAGGVNRGGRGRPPLVLTGSSGKTSNDHAHLISGVITKNASLLGVLASLSIGLSGCGDFAGFGGADLPER